MEVASSVKNMKKVISVFIIFTVLLPLFALCQEKVPKKPPTFRVVPGGAPVDGDNSLVFITNRNVHALNQDTEETSTFFQHYPTKTLKYGRYNYRFLGSKHKQGAFDDTVKWYRSKRLTETEALDDPKPTLLKPEVFVIVHGYNTDFDDSVKQAVLFKHDLYTGHQDTMKFFDFKVFSWASKGNPVVYTNERMDIKSNAPPMAEFISKIIRARGQEKVNFILHSMGNDVFLTAIEYLDASGELKNLRFGRVILAASDVSQKHFQAVVPKLIERSRKVVQYISVRDQALGYSKKVNILAGGARAGAMVLPIQGLEVVDCEEVTDPDDRSAHSYYASSRLVLDDIAGLLQDDSAKKTPDERYPDRFEKRKLDSGFEYWAFKGKAP
jgi:esterase/lipase superfamily enzyme